MRSLRIDNPALNNYVTDLAEDYSTGTALVVRNNNSFQANDLSVVGDPGEELTEGKKINSVAGSTGVTLASTLNFAHNKGTHLFKSLWDFVVIEGRSSSAGVFATLTQSPIQWDSKENKTIYNHDAGTDTWEYRFRFYNSVTLTYSEYSPTLSGAGFTKFQMGYIIKEARRIAGDKPGRILTTDECLRALTRAKNIIRAHNGKYWFWKVRGKQADKKILATAGNNIYDLSSIDDLGTIDGVQYNYNANNSNTIYSLRRKDDSEFEELTRDLNRPENDYSRFFRQLPPDANSEKGYFEIENKIQNNGVGIFYINYYKEEPDYDSVEDSTSIIMPQILEDYLIGEIYATKGNADMAKKYYKIFTGPENREKTLALADLTGIALLDELDKQYKQSAGQPKSLWRFRGARAVSRMYGNRSNSSPDYDRENYFRDER